MVDSLCSRYPSLNPFLVRKTKAREVFRLIRLIKNSQKYNKEDDETRPLTNINSTPKRRNVTGKAGTGGWI